MECWKDELRLIIAGDDAIALQRLAHERGAPLLEVMRSTVRLLLAYDRLSQQGYHIGLAKDPSRLEIRFTEPWEQPGRQHARAHTEGADQGPRLGR